jgi:putative redox protein
MKEAQTMTATSTRADGFRQVVRVRDHQLSADEPREHGGLDAGPSPLELLSASLAACTAITMEMYAQRKGWDIGDVEVECGFTPSDRGCPTRFAVTLRIPESLPDDVAQRLQVIAAKCPVHRALDGEVMFDEHVERVSLVR